MPSAGGRQKGAPNWTLQEFEYIATGLLMRLKGSGRPINDEDLEAAMIESWKDLGFTSGRPFKAALKKMDVTARAARLAFTAYAVDLKKHNERPSAFSKPSLPKKFRGKDSSRWKSTCHGVMT